MCRWVTNTFSSTPTTILLRKVCLPPIDTNCKYRRDHAALRIACAPPTDNPTAAILPPSVPSLSVFRALDSPRPLTRGLTSVYLHLNWRTPVPAPPVRKPLPINALAHLTLPYAEGLSRFPLVLKMPLLPGTNISPVTLMAQTYYMALRWRARQALLDRLAEDLPTPPYYPYPLCHEPHPFMGLDKFIAGRIHQMRAGKSYLAAHPSWFNEEPDHTCPQCASSRETFEHDILYCPERMREKTRLLEDVSSLGPDSPVWTEPSQIHALGRFIPVTELGFPVPRSRPATFFPTPSSPSPPHSMTDDD